MSNERVRCRNPQELPQRRACLIGGIVQGVGFRPFVYRLAMDLGLSGFVCNQSGVVYLEVEGPPEALERFGQQLHDRPPPRARIASIEWQRLAFTGTVGFQIRDSSQGSPQHIFISPDLATCADCLKELFDPVDRRYAYPFLNCTNCGPRLTIIRGSPYDRSRTTMSGFPMCTECRAEYEHPENRRFHAQPIACPACGPQLRLLDRTGQPTNTPRPLEVFAQSIVAGQIGALKGLGGYHLVCDAGNEFAVNELRRRKHRDEKPFAVMVNDLEHAARYCELDTVEAQLLDSPRRPIVLLRKHDRIKPDAIAESIAPAHPNLGVMLPYTPLHYLLMQATDGRPLVMTSGNRSDEPIAYEDEDAIERLTGIADLFLTHNRPIRVRCDDSVTRSVSSQVSPHRRSRGYAPEPISLPVLLQSQTLAVGGQLKSTFALGHERLAFLSHHLGDLDHFAAYQAFERDIQLYEDLFAVIPEAIVHDLHPDYASTGYASRRAERSGLRLLAVQHHHAHVASAMAEHGLIGRVIGIAFDGTGYGLDGAIWGGEFLDSTYAEFTRVGRLRYVGLPGGDAAIREPWRIAAAHLIDAGCNLSSLSNAITSTNLRIVQQMVQRNFNTPQTSSVGRLFDAVAAIAGLRTHVRFEGQAAIELEWLATKTAEDGIYPYRFEESLTASGELQFTVDTRPLISAVASDVNECFPQSVIARRFHSTLVDVIAAGCNWIRRVRGLEQVVLTGGVFMNSLLASESDQRLSDLGFHVYRHRAVPCNDGGISLGQLAVAAVRDH